MEIRDDLKEVETLLQRLAQFASVFHTNNCENWLHQKNNEDFDRVYRLDHNLRWPLEQIYCRGRDLAVCMAFKLVAFNQPELFPTLKKFVDSFDGEWLDEIDSLGADSQAAKAIHAGLDHHIWSVGQMIQLFDEQIELLTDIKRTLEGLKQSATYKFESGAIESPVPTGSTVAPVPRTTWDKIHGIALLWYGDPNASFAKFFAIPGVALIAAPWWQPVLQQAAVHYLDVPPNSLAEADCKLFWSGWILVVIAVCLYIWLKQATSKIRHTAA